MTNAFEQRFLAARRAAIAAAFSNLNEMQQKAVLTTEGPLLLLAGAGSGKTTVLIHRIANLIEYGCGSDSNEIPDYVNEDDVQYLEDCVSGKTEHDPARTRALCALRPVAPWSIIAITFTNKAANELKTRLQLMLGEAALDVWAMTFHSACCRILRRDIDRLGYSSSFTIYDTADSERVIKDIVKERGLDDKAFASRMILSIISRAKDKRQNPEEFEASAAASGDYRMERIAEVYAEYQTRLKRANALDFDDIILKTVELLENFDDVRLRYQQKFRYVLIDEYQDTNLLQYQLSALLAGGYENICVVGDDDQSIYKFRGATIENILDFEKQYQGAQVIRLEQNYRSTGSILQCANAVIANNRGRKGKTLWTKNPTGDKIIVHEASSESDEAQYIANRIIVSRSRGVDFKDHAVLYRTNAQSNALEYAFKRSGIPYRIIGGTRYFDRAEVKDMLAYLCLINNRGDDLRLRRIINNPPRGIGPKTVEMAERQAAAAGNSVYSVISDPYSYPCLERAAQKLMAFTVMIEECEALLETLSLPDFYDEVLARTGYFAMLEEKDDTEARTRAENVRELRSSIVNYMENTDTPTLAGFLEEIALYTDIEQYDANADAAVMMTMHSAKGLEFPNVYLVGMEEGIFPGMKVLSEPDELEEERRLCYVAITRAKQSLCICHARSRMLYGRTSSNLPSRFIDELPDACVERSGNLPPRREPSFEPARVRPSLYGDDDGWYQPSRPTKPMRDYSVLTKPAAQKTANVQFAKGDMVMHKAFGKGLVLTVLPMGNDALLEIAFDGVGTKKLMANAAGAHMQKL